MVAGMFHVKMSLKLATADIKDTARTFYVTLTTFSMVTSMYM